VTFNRIVTETSSDVAAIINGHTHLKYSWTPGDRPVVQTGSYGDNVGHITLTLDTSTPGTLAPVTAASVENIARNTSWDTATQDAIGNIPAIRAIVDAALAYGATAGNRTVAAVDATIGTAFSGGTWTGDSYTGGSRDDRANESTLGRLVADAYLWTAENNDVIGGADIGIINAGGGLRAELIYDALKDGKITYAEANAVQPFVNNLWTVEITGAQFKTFLEEQWSYNQDLGARNSRPFLNTGVSSNVTYTVSTDQPLGELLPPELCTLDSNCEWNDARSHITSVFVDGKPLDPDKVYKIITVSFLTTGGDNFWVMNEGANHKDTGLVDRDAWIGYLLDASGTGTPGGTPTKAISPSYARMSVVLTNLVPATKPMDPIKITAGDSISFTLSRLNLTSQGSPANVSVKTNLVPAAGGAGVLLGEFPVSGPADTAAAAAAGVSPDLNPLSTGAAKVEVTIPQTTVPGTYYLTTTALPSNTTVTLAVEVAGVILPPVSIQFDGTGSRSVTFPYDFGLFTEVRSGGAALNPAYYTATSGSTVITFTEAYLKTLAAGVYNYTAVFQHGTAAITLNVSVPTQIPDVVNPISNTGGSVADGFGVGPLGLLLITTGAAILGIRRRVEA
jgi:5'-nucleotidase